MTEIRLKYAELQNCAQAMASASKAIESRLQQLMGELKTLDWSNQARDSYMAVEKDMTQKIEDMKQILGQIGTAVTDAHDGYKNVEQQGVNAWQG